MQSETKNKNHLQRKKTLLVYLVDRHQNGSFLTVTTGKKFTNLCQKLCTPKSIGILQIPRIFPVPLRLKGQVGANRSVKFSTNESSKESMTFSLHWLLTASLAATGLPISRQLGVRTCTIDEFWSHSSKPDFKPFTHFKHFTKLKIMPLKMLFNYGILKLNCF